MIKLTKKWQVLIIYFTTIFLAVFFVDTSNLLDIFSGKDFIITHPDNFISDNSEILESIALQNSTFYSLHATFDISKVNIIKKVLQDEDSPSTELNFTSEKRFIKIYDNVNLNLIDYFQIKQNLFLEYCSLII